MRRLAGFGYRCKDEGIEMAIATTEKLLHEARAGRRLAFDEAVRLYRDADLLELDSLWAAAGHPHAVFNLSPNELVSLTGAPVADVALREPA